MCKDLFSENYTVQGGKELKSLEMYPTDNQMEAQWTQARE